MDKNTNTDGKKTVSEKISAWLVKYRFVLLGIIGAIILCAVVIGVIIAVDENNRKNGFAVLDKVETEYVSMLSDSSLSDEEKAEKEATFRADVSKLTGKGAVGSRAYSLLADIDFNAGNYEAAKEEWLASSTANPKAYTAPLALYNVAICCEELGDVDGAVANLLKSVEADGFPLKSRALFNAGRLEESRGNWAQAAEYYNRVNDEFSGDTWADFAKTRVLTLETEGKLN